MPYGKLFDDDFDTLNGDFWRVSDFTVAANWNQTAWDPTYLDTGTPGEITLNLDGTDTDGKAFTGSEIQSVGFYSYGSYEVEMIASGESGVVSSFFLFTDTFFGASQHNEIDIEFLGDDTTVMNINYYYGADRLGANGSVQIDLGFDAAAAMHTYRIDWQPDSISWYADDTLIYEVSGEGIPLPDEAMRIYSSIWTGGEGLENWHGPVDPDVSAQATYSSISYRPEVITGTDTVSFAGHTEGYEIDLVEGAYKYAIRVMPMGDSLTLGVLDRNDETEVHDLREGYRYDLLERVLAGGGWMDYVGYFQNGPDEMIDRDHGAIGGKRLADIVDDTGGTSDFEAALNDHAPDVVLFMAGTNDFFNDGVFYTEHFPNIMGGIADAIEQFYAIPENVDNYLVVSTLPPKFRSGVPLEFADYLNDGYSTVDGEVVAGDAGNGTYVAGVKALVASYQALHPTLVLFENPLEGSDLSLDSLHFTQFGYQRYAEALFATLESEIGIANGNFGESFALPGTVTNATGGDGGDRLNGSMGANVLDGSGGNDLLEGRGGADTLTGGTGRDTFVYGADVLDGTTDVITDYDQASGDVINIGALVESFGWDDAQIAANVALTDGPSGAEITVTTPTGTQTIVRVDGVNAADVTLQTASRVHVFERPEILYGSERGDDLFDIDEGRKIFGLDGDDRIFAAGGNDTISAGGGFDTISGGAGADVFAYDSTDLDGFRDTITDFSIAEGDTLDLSGIGVDLGLSAQELFDALQLNDQSAGLRFRLNLPTAEYNFAILSGVTKSAFMNSGALVLEAGPPPDTGDDDGNLALALPDGVITAGEEGSVAVTLSGLDADATAVVTLTASNGATRTQSASADGTLTFDLAGLPDGAVTTSVTATDGGGNATTVAGPGLTLSVSPDVSADEDGNLAVSAPDTAISDTEVTAVAFDVSGIDADASAVLTVSDGTASVTGSLAADGRVILDLSPLADGALSVSLTATDIVGNTATVAGPALSLDATTDTTADLDGNLAVSAPDVTIDATELAAVAFDVSGIDADATAELTVSDGTATVSASVAADGTVTLDLSSLADGALSVLLTATDGAGNTATAEGPGMTIDRTPSLTLEGTTRSDTLVDGDQSTEIYGLAGHDMITAGGGDDTIFGGADKDTIEGGAGNDVIEGGSGKNWLYGGTGADRFVFGADALDGSRDEVAGFSLADGDVIDFRPMAQELGLTTAEMEAAISLRGIDVGVRIDVQHNGTNYVVAAVYNVTETDLIGSGALVLEAGPPPDTGDDDGNLALALPDGVITAGEEGSVAVTLSGLDADATAVVTLTASNGATRTQSASADGTLTFDLAGLPDGAVTTSVTATDGGGNATTVAGPGLTLSVTPDVSADEDGNLAVSAPDTAISDTEVTAVAFDVSGIDADASAVLTVSDGTASVTGSLAADGRVILDLSSLADGALSVSLTATDIVGNTATVAGPALSLDATTDTTADLDGNLAVSAPDVTIDATELAAVAFDVSGIDADATAELTVSDGTATVSASVAADGTVTLDLSSLADGALSVLLTATDGAGNTATAEGPGMTIDRTPSLTLEGTTRSDTLVDGDQSTEIYGLAGHDMITAGGGDDTIFGGADKDTIEGGAGNDVIEGGSGKNWLYGGTGADRFVFGADALDGSRDEVAGFSLADGDVIDFRPMAQELGLTTAEMEAAISLRGIDVGVRIDVQHNGTNYVVAAVYNVTETDLIGSGALVLEAGPPPDTGDDDGNLALALPDGVITAGEEGSVAVTLSGLDADATAVVTLTASNGATRTQSASADGTLTFDLAGLPDGAVTTSVTATDGGGNATTVAGPGLTLSVTPDVSADEDGNLAVSAPDTAISDTEVTAVAFDVSGIDADASAVLTVSDGTASVTGSLAADGRVILDLSSLADGALSVSLTATDIVGNTATVAGPALSLDATTDTTADLDGNLAVSAPDVTIDATELAAVAFDVSGIDADATAELTVSDGTATVSASVAADGTVTLDLSSLADGALSVLLTATDGAGNTATAEGPGMTIDRTPSLTLEGTTRSDTLVDGDQSTEIYGLAGHDMITAGGGDDTIFGGADKDTIEGGAGNDVIEGGSGKNWLYGGTGADRFVFGADALDGSRDEVAGFSLADGDVIDFRPMAQELGLTTAEMEAAISLRGIDVGVRISVEHEGVSYNLAAIYGVMDDVLIDSDAMWF